MLDNGQSKEMVAGRLESIVNSFNKSLAEWQKETNCVVSFGWQYNKADESLKQLEIQTIDLAVYRKPPPAYLSMQGGEGKTLDRSDLETKTTSP